MYEELMEKENPAFFILMGVLSFYLWKKIVSSPISFSSEKNDFYKKNVKPNRKRWEHDPEML